jgi:hypothetical protein
MVGGRYLIIILGHDHAILEIIEDALDLGDARVEFLGAVEFDVLDAVDFGEGLGRFVELVVRVDTVWAQRA